MAVEGVIAEHLSERLGSVGDAAVLRGSALAAALVGVFKAGVRCWALDPAWEGQPVSLVLDQAFPEGFPRPAR